MSVTGTTTRQALTRLLPISNRLFTWPEVVPLVPLRSGPMLVLPSPCASVIGRKGRKTLARRRVLDGAFLAGAMGVVALLWWSTL